MFRLGYKNAYLHTKVHSYSLKKNCKSFQIKVKWKRVPFSIILLSGISRKKKRDQPQTWRIRQIPTLFIFLFRNATQFCIMHADSQQFVKQISHLFSFYGNWESSHQNKIAIFHHKPVPPTSLIIWVTKVQGIFCAQIIICSYILKNSHYTSFQWISSKFLFTFLHTANDNSLFQQLKTKKKNTHLVLKLNWMNFFYCFCIGFPVNIILLSRSSLAQKINLHMTLYVDLFSIYMWRKSIERWNEAVFFNH